MEMMLYAIKTVETFHKAFLFMQHIYAWILSFVLNHFLGLHFFHLFFYHTGYYKRETLPQKV